MTKSILTRSQKKIYGTKQFDYYGDQAILTVFMRYDDECGNGHNTFSITGEIKVINRRYRNGDCEACGCLHDEIIKVFPELKEAIIYHLCSSDGPLHYIANTMYHATDKDRKYSKGEPNQWEEQLYFGDFPAQYKTKSKVLNFAKYLSEFNSKDLIKYVEKLQIIEIEHKDVKTYGCKYTISGMLNCNEWYQCPFETRLDAEQFIECLKRYPVIIKTVVTGYSKGKELNLEYARSSAIWPDATLEQLKNKELLLERLPKLMSDFKAMVESFGFIY